MWAKEILEYVCFAPHLIYQKKKLTKPDNGFWIHYLALSVAQLLAMTFPKTGAGYQMHLIWLRLKP